MLEAKIGCLSFTSTGHDEGSWLGRDFEEGEVFEVVKALNGDKGLGLDGFSMVFFLDLLGGRSLKRI